MSWILVNEAGKESDPYDSRGEAEKKKAELEGLGATIDLKRQPASDGGSSIDQDSADVVEMSEHAGGNSTDSNGEPVAQPQPVENEIPESSTVTEDPISWMPEHFIDIIEGVPAINRKGYAVLAEHYGISIVAEPVTYPSESDWEYAEFRAVATTPEGDEYSGFGSAHIDRGDDKTLLGELAETRAIKRATANATGVGMTAVSEIQNSTRGEGT